MNKLFLSIVLILVFIVIYFILIEIFSVLLRIYGLNKEKAKFQAISLLTSVGFSTAESEAVMKDPSKRKVAIVAMITGYSFSVIIMSLLINLFLNLNTEQTEESALFIIVSFILFALIMVMLRIPFINKKLDKLIEKTALSVLKKKGRYNTITMLDNFGKDCICEIDVKVVPDFLESKSLFESHIKDLYNMNVLMIHRKDRTLDATAASMIQRNDTILVFGNYNNIMKTFGTDLKDAEKKLDIEDKIHENVLDLINNYGYDAMAEIKINRVPQFLESKSLLNSGIKDIYQINVLMVKREGKPLKVTKDTMIMKDDTIIVFGPFTQIKRAFMYKEEER